MRCRQWCTTPMVRSFRFVAAVFFVTFRGAHAGLRGPGSDGKISLAVALPLTKHNVSAPDPGWIQLAAALMAVDHFNARDPSVVPELEDLRCNLAFGNVTVLDTGRETHVSMEELIQKAMSRGLPDAIAGPYNEVPALELSVIATSLRIPIVAHRATDYNLLQPEKHPFFSQVSADSFSEMEFLATYLNHTNRTNFIAVVYSSTSASVRNEVDVSRTVLEKAGIDQVRTFAYHPRQLPSGSLHDASVRDTLEKVKATGFRTIVVVSDNLQRDGPEIHEAASGLGLDHGNHFWILMGGVSELTISDQLVRLRESNATYGDHNFLQGAAQLTPYEGFNFSLNQFPKFLFHQNKSFVERLEAMTPIRNYYNWSLAAMENNFTFASILNGFDGWWMGSSYLYDATMAIGMGACRAAETKPATMSGLDHLKGIRSVDFMGATGRIAFEGIDSGRRKKSTVPFSVVNMLPPGTKALYTVPEVMDPSTSQFILMDSNQSFVYADGSHSPPSLLRDIPDQNYLPPGLRAIGLSLMSIALVVIFLSTVWICRHREHEVVMAAQPWFLYALCLGSAITTTNIFFTSNDESYDGWDEDSLDKACVASVWVSSIGSWTIYGALLTKHWRVNRLMQHKDSNQVSTFLVLGPCLLFTVTLVTILSYWTATSNYGWERIEIDEVTGESIGQCNGEVIPWFWLIMVLLALPVALAGILAYKTLGVDDLYSEGKYVLIFILVQLEVTLVAAPLTQILRGISTEGSYIGISLLIWIIPMSTMGLMVLPKMLLVRKMKREADASDENLPLQQQSASQDPQRRGGSDAAVATNEEDSLVASTPRTADLGSPTPLVNGPRIQVVTFD